LFKKNYSIKDKDAKAQNISMDMYESSVYNDEERKTLLFEQIQQILISALEVIVTGVIGYLGILIEIILEKRIKMIK